MNKDMTFCMTLEPDNPECSTCVRRRCHKENDRFNGEILSLTQFRPEKQKDGTYKCTYKIKESNE